MNREVMWRSLDGDKFEHVQITTKEDRFEADGLIILDADTSCRIRYRIECDSAWQVRKVHLQRLDTSDQQLMLLTDGKGSWNDKKGNQIKALEKSLCSFHSHHILPGPFISLKGRLYIPH